MIAIALFIDEPQNESFWGAAMGLTVTITDSAHAYGADNVYITGAPAGLFGSPVSQSFSSPPTVGAFTNLTETFTNGVSLVETVYYNSTTSATITAIQVHAGSTLLITALGAVTINLQNPDPYSLLSGSDTITGNSYNNILEGGAGVDHIDGGGGVDTVVYRGFESSFNIAPSGAAIVVSGANVSETLVNVERLKFDDYSVAFDTSGTAGEAYRLYQAALNRAPDMGGLGYYIRTLDAGWHEHDIAVGFLQSPEFTRLYGSGLSDSQFVTQLYANVLHRAPDAGGLAYQVNALATGTDRAQLLVNFSESPENQAALIGVMQKGMLFIP